MSNLSAANLNNVDAASKADIPADFDTSEIQQATEENISIASVPSLLEAQAEFIQDLFELIKDVLTKVITAEAKYGMALATRMPAMTPHTTGYFPMKMNMRNLVPGQRPRYWASTEAFRAAASTNSAQKADVSLAAQESTTEKESTSSSGGSSGGCEAGVGLGALAALTFFTKFSKNIKLHAQNKTKKRKKISLSKIGREFFLL